MKVQVTAKAICQGYRKIFATDYCELQSLFPGHTAPWFHAGVYGWNADYFSSESRSILLVTGYRIGAATRGFTREVVDLSHDFVFDFEKRAQLIVKECGWTKPEKREARMNELREEFWEALNNYTKEV